MRERIKNCLNNENAGPSVEMLIGIGIALAAGVALFRFGGAIFGIYKYQAGRYSILRDYCDPKIGPS